MAHLFMLGKIALTHGVNKLVNGDHSLLHPFLMLHVKGQWGDLSEDDKQANDEALNQTGGRLLSAYNLPQGKIWIVTEADRSSSTVLLPSEY